MQKQDVLKAQNVLFFKELSQAVEDELPLAKSFCLFLLFIIAFGSLWREAFDDCSVSADQKLCEIPFNLLT